MLEEAAEEWEGRAEEWEGRAGRSGMSMMSTTQLSELSGAG
jgi:hypothetical protein